MVVPKMKAFAPVFTKPVVKVSVPETVPVLDPDNSELAPEKVTPEALVLLIVNEVKFAVGEAVRFRNVPLPLIVWAVVDATSDVVPAPPAHASVPVVVNVPLFVRFPAIAKVPTVVRSSPDVMVMLPKT
jgi:hypothetical protein